VSVPPLVPSARLQLLLLTSRVRAFARLQLDEMLTRDEILTIIDRSTGVTADPDEGLMDAGVDSLGATELVNELQTKVGDLT
jgi:aryl carrier-like protein